MYVLSPEKWMFISIRGFGIAQCDSETQPAGVVPPVSTTMDLKETKASDASAWIGGKLKFSELSFADISKQLERRFNVNYP